MSLLAFLFLNREVYPLPLPKISLPNFSRRDSTI
jgi:hypothetical protein